MAQISQNPDCSQKCVGKNNDLYVTDQLFDTRLPVLHCSCQSDGCKYGHDAFINSLRMLTVFKMSLFLLENELLKLVSRSVVYTGDAAVNPQYTVLNTSPLPSLPPLLSLPLSSFIFLPAISLPVFLLHRHCRKINLTNRSALLISLHLPSCV